MDFVSIDFETATSAGASICSMGICVVEHDQITEQREILIKPEPFEFNDYNIQIHGITPEMVKYRHTFDYYWEEIKPYVDNKLIIAHNAGFDVGALRAALDTFHLEYPTFDYLCTVALSQKAYPELSSHRLNSLSDALGVRFNHHHAMDDAYACARVLLRILEDYSLTSLDEVEECFEIEIGKLYPGYHAPCRKNKKRRRKKASVNNAG